MEHVDVEDLGPGDGLEENFVWLEASQEPALAEEGVLANDMQTLACTSKLGRIVKIREDLSEWPLRLVNYKATQTPPASIYAHL